MKKRYPCNYAKSVSERRNFFPEKPHLWFSPVYQVWLVSWKPCAGYKGSFDGAIEYAKRCIK